MNNIKEDIKRCKKLTEPQNANWIGITNQVAIARLIGRIKELEETDLTTVYMKGYSDCEEKYRKKVKDKIENETIDISGFKCIAVEDLKELLEEDK